MSDTRSPDDRRSVSELIESARGGDEEESDRAIQLLHWRGSEEVLSAAVDLCASELPEVRALGAKILGQIGVPERTFPEECFETLEALLDDPDVKVVKEAIWGLQFADRERAASFVLKFSDHINSDVRYAVAIALGGLESREAVDALMKLMADSDPDVRNWATFGISRLCDIDNADVRDTLVARLNDENEDVRYEAVCGLAKRRDRRVLSYLIPMLIDYPDDSAAYEASIEFLGLEPSDEMPIQELIGALERLRRFNKLS